MKAAAVLVFVGMALAGCIGAAPGPDRIVPASMPAPAASHGHDFAIQAQGCDEAGGQSTYNLEAFQGLLPKPWKAADVREDIGDPMLLGLGVVNEGKGIAGIYHATFTCKQWSVDGEAKQDLMMGFVGIRVEPPPFDPGGADKHYLISVLTAGDDHVHGDLADLGFMVHPGRGVIERVGTMMHQVLDDEMHGVYDTRFVPHDAGAMKPAVARLWMVVGTADHHDAAFTPSGDHAPASYRPVAIDMRSEGGQHLWAEQGQATFTHLRTEDHGPLPGAAGNVAAQAWMGFDRAIWTGPMPEVELDQTWEHL